MEKTFSKIEISVIKSAAKNAAPYVAKKHKLEAQIKEVEEKVAEQIRKRAEEKIEKIRLEMNGYQSIIDSLNASVKQITGGYTTEDLIDIKKEATGQMDQKTGKEIFKTVYALKYPDTVVPPTTQQSEAESTEGLQNEEPEANEMPEELMAEQAEAAEEVEKADPFAETAEGDPFNQ
jgi:metal-dependent amidase/aminoacylase/carboxypeptidase family protein